MRPLAGVTVVSIEQAVSAPFATRQLADLGARVIKIERPDGGDFARGYDTTVRGLSSYFVWLNRSKESLTLDLKRPEGLDILHRLIARADVFVQNLAPGAAGRLGAAAADLRPRHPGLVVCSITGYGDDGPFARRKAYDLLVQAEAGVMALTGTPAEPARIGLSVADIAAGSSAFSGILAALYARQTTHEGETVDVSMLDALAEWTAAPAYFTRYGGTAPARSGPHHATVAPYGPFASREGHGVFLAVQNDREWQRFCQDVLGNPELGAAEHLRTNSGRVAHRAELHTAIEAAFVDLSEADIVARLDRAGIAHARLRSVEGLLSHPQILARGRWQPVDSPAGPLELLAPPVAFGGFDPVMGPIPALGAHTDAILSELGIDAATRDAWRREGVI